MNWKIACLIGCLSLSTSLVACSGNSESTNPAPSPDASVSGDAMKGGAMKHDAMKHDAMKHDAMKHDAMKHDAMKHGTAPKPPSP